MRRPPPFWHAHRVTVAAAILGGIAGFAIGVLFTEVLFSNSQSWPDVVPFALAVLGMLTGAALGRRLSLRR